MLAASTTILAILTRTLAILAIHGVSTKRIGLYIISISITTILAASSAAIATITTSHGHFNYIQVLEIILRPCIKDF